MDKTTIYRLRKHLSYRKGQAIRLQQENRQLHARHSILQAYCQALSWLHGQACTEWLVEATQQGQQGLQGASGADAYCAEELLLLQQLQDEHTVPLMGQSQPALAPQTATQQQQQQQLSSSTCGLEGGSNCEDWLQELQQPLAAAAAAGAWGQGPVNGNSHSEVQQTSSMSGVRPASAADAAAVAGHAVQQEPTVAPDNDLLYLFRRIFAMPQFPGAASMSMQGVAAVYNEAVRELSLNLALHEAALQHPVQQAAAQPAASVVGSTAVDEQGSQECQVAGPLQNIRTAFDRLYNLYVTLSQLQRNDLLMIAALVNNADMSEPLLLEADMADHTRCVRLVGLSATQQQQIADGFAVFSRLLEPVLQGMRQLQLQQPQCAAHNTAGCTCMRAGGVISCSGKECDSATAGAGSGSSSTAWAGHGNQPAAAAAAAVHGGLPELLTAEGYKSHREALHQQEQRTAQMKQLMRKDVLIKAAFMAYMYGRFTYPQLAKLYVSMYPRQPAIATMGRAIVAIFEAAQT